MDKRSIDIALRQIKRCENELAQIWKSEGYESRFSGKAKLERINEAYNSISEWESFLPYKFKREQTLRHRAIRQPFKNPKMIILR